MERSGTLAACRRQVVGGVRDYGILGGSPGVWRILVKTIGIVGGVAWPSSIVYYRAINELVACRLGGLHCADLVLVQADFAEVERRQREGRWDLVGDLLAVQGNRLRAAGADFFLLACNTVHAASDHIEKAVDLPFLHIVDPAARQVVAGGFQTMGLLGSRYPMTD